MRIAVHTFFDLPKPSGIPYVIYNQPVGISHRAALEDLEGLRQKDAAATDAGGVVKTVLAQRIDAQAVLFFVHNF